MSRYEMPDGQIWNGFSRGKSGRPRWRLSPNCNFKELATWRSSFGRDLHTKPVSAMMRNEMPTTSIGHDQAMHFPDWDLRAGMKPLLSVAMVSFSCTLFSIDRLLNYSEITDSSLSLT